jgi:hypothetical protein
MSDQVIAEIERSVDRWADGLKQLCMVFYAGGGWVVSCHALSLRTSNADVMVALREFEDLARAFIKRDMKLAQTLGLEAAE